MFFITRYTTVINFICAKIRECVLFTTLFDILSGIYCLILWSIVWTSCRQTWLHRRMYRNKLLNFSLSSVSFPLRFYEMRMLLQNIRSFSPLGMLPLRVSSSCVQFPNSFDQCMVTGTRSWFCLLPLPHFSLPLFIRYIC